MASEESPPISFSSLPLDLRYEIYRHYFDSTFDRHQSAVYNAQSLPRESNTGIFRVSRTISEESRKTFYSRTEFAAVDNVAGLQQFLLGIGKENRLFVRSLIIRLERFASSEHDHYDRRAIEELYLCCIFETLALGHNLRRLSFEFAASALEAFTFSESIGQSFYKLRGVERVEIRFTVPFVHSTSAWHLFGLQTGTLDSGAMLEHPSLVSVASAMIASAQRPPEPAQHTSSPNEHVGSMTETMLPSFPGQITFVTRREWLANELRHAEELQFRAICRVYELLEEIDGIDSGIAGVQSYEDGDIDLTWAENIASTIWAQDPP